MAKLVFGMNLSLDGYVDHDASAPDAVVYRRKAALDRKRGRPPAFDTAKENEKAPD